MSTRRREGVGEDFRGAVKLIDGFDEIFGKSMRKMPACYKSPVCCNYLRKVCMESPKHQVPISHLQITIGC